MPQTPHPDQSVSAIPCAVLTLSDTRTAETDKSGQLIQTKLKAVGHQMVAYCATTLIFCLPGSAKAVGLALDKLILPELFHLRKQLRGRG